MSWNWFMWILSYSFGCLCSNKNSMLASQAFQTKFSGINRFVFLSLLLRASRVLTWLSILIFVISFSETEEPFLLLYSAVSKSGVSQVASFRCWYLPACVSLMWFCFPSQWPGHGEHPAVSSEPNAWRGGRGDFTVLQVKPISVTVCGRHLIFFYILITIVLIYLILSSLCCSIYNFSIYFNTYTYIHKYIYYVF